MPQQLRTPLLAGHSTAPTPQGCHGLAGAFGGLLPSATDAAAAELGTPTRGVRSPGFPPAAAEIASFNYNPLAGQPAAAVSPSAPPRLLGGGGGSSLEERVVVRELLLFLVREIEKQRHFQHLPLYLIFLFILTGQMFATRDVTAAYSDGLQMADEARATLHTSELVEVRARDAYWSWLSAAISGVWSAMRYNTSCTSRDAVHNIPIGVLLLRQWRVRRKDCPAPPPLAESDRLRVPCSCMPSYDESDISAEPYGPGVGQGWVPDSMLPRPAYPVGVRTVLHNYQRTESQFALIVPLTQNESSALASVAALAAAHWVDAATRVVSLETLFLNPSTDKLVHVTSFMEILPSGRSLPGVMCNVFEFFGLSSDRGRLIFAFDVLITAAVPIFFYGLITVFRLRRRCDPGAWPYVGPIEVYELGFNIALVWLLVRRWTVWANSLEILNGDSLAEDARSAGFQEAEGAEERFTFYRIAAFSHMAADARTSMAVCLVLSYLRTFKYFQHFTLLNMLTETVRRAFWELMRLLVIWAVILCGYSSGACIMYGQDVHEFETLSSSFSFLVRILFQVGEDTEFSWTRMKEVNPELTPWFMGSYYGLSFLLLLNMALAAIVSSFTQVQHARDEANRKDEKRDRRAQQLLTSLRASKALGGAGVTLGLRGAVWARLLRRAGDVAASCAATCRGFVARLAGREQHDVRRHMDTVKMLKEHCKRRLRLPISELDANPQLYAGLRVTFQELCDAVGDASQKHAPSRGLAHVFWSTRRREIERSDVLILLYEGFERVCEYLLAVHNLQQSQQPPAAPTPRWQGPDGGPGQSGRCGGGDGAADGAGNSSTAAALLQNAPPRRRRRAKPSAAEPPASGDAEDAPAPCGGGAVPSALQRVGSLHPPSATMTMVEPEPQPAEAAPGPPQLGREGRGGSLRRLSSAPQAGLTTATANPAEQPAPPRSTPHPLLAPRLAAPGLLAPPALPSAPQSRFSADGGSSFVAAAELALSAQESSYFSPPPVMRRTHPCPPGRHADVPARLL
eukprot:TRINITY_DN6497_c0_g1_i1.p1 TRINITY_DN6497_c0_g1~~TRINITY_DN6497_c0_g1_i1.p1  ORF type:complete len:1052 (+),score=242.36 TRINITY_DN6497_c0_g1_i1:86-3157(+)